MFLLLVRSWLPHLKSRQGKGWSWWKSCFSSCIWSAKYRGANHSKLGVRDFDLILIYFGFVKYCVRDLFLRFAPRPYSAAKNQWNSYPCSVFSSNFKPFQSKNFWIFGQKFLIFILMYRKFYQKVHPYSTFLISCLENRP